MSSMPSATSGPNKPQTNRNKEMSMSPHKNISPRPYSNGYSSDQTSDLDDPPTYLLEHLATFAVGRQHGIVDPTDGLHRLWQMEKTTGIWTQRMQMRLEKKWIIIVDFETGDTVERFPIHLISTPMAFAGNDPKELYNNILVFIVKEETNKQQKNITPAEMHIFQCVRISAQEVVEDIKLFMVGNYKSVYSKSERPTQLPPPPPSSDSEFTLNGFTSRTPPNRYNSANLPTVPTPPLPNPEMLAHLGKISDPSHYNSRDLVDDNSSTSSEKYERDVAILNHCFDDIERFIARLQSAAAAYRELERRRRTRKSKKKDHGDGMLSLRAKPPPEREFVDVLQKFKLSFNLLAKLKSHIHDPNAPELVHFLFTPLALIVDASRDSNHGPNLAAKVVSPLLTLDAIQLLANCLTSKESDLWHSLGESWIVPRDSWKGYVASYHPTFSDGWSPEYPFGEDRERAELTANAAASAAQQARRAQILAAQHEAEAREREYHPPSRNSGNYYDESEHGVDVGIVQKTKQMFEGRKRESPYLEYHERDLQSDISADSIERSMLGNAAYDPQRHMERAQRQWLDDLRARDARVVQVIFPRTANNDKELTVFRGEYLEVLDDSRKWWKARNFRGQIAHVPHTIVTPYHAEEDAVFNNPLYARRDTVGSYGQDSPNRSTDGSVSGDRPSPRAPPIPPPAPAPAEQVRNERIGKRGEFRYF